MLVMFRVSSIKKLPCHYYTACFTCYLLPQGQSSSPTSVATVSISTSAVTTITHRDRHATPENPFGVIGEVATVTTAFQSNYTRVYLF